jgi:hypothetical protein
MDLPALEAEPMMRRRRRRTVVLAVLAVAMLGLFGVAAYAVTDHNTSRVVVATSGTQYPVQSVARRSDTTTTQAHREHAAIRSVATITVPKTLPLPTTPSTRSYVPPPAPTTPLPTNPPATLPPTTHPPTTAAAKTASLHVTPAAADFPSTPPPYWPMPIVAVTITNTGGVAIHAIVVHPVGVYSVPSSTCTALMPGQSCVAKVQFCPSSPGQYLNTLAISGTNALTGEALQASITLHGTAT